MLKTVDRSALIELSACAQSAPRQRANFNLHPELSDPVQRFLNAIEPTSYVRPHRHMTPEGRWELFIALRGSVAVLILDDSGKVIDRVRLDAGGDTCAVEIPSGTWHTLVALEPGTVLFEVKTGPYAPTSDKDFAPWTPPEGDRAATAMIERFRSAAIGDRLAPG